MASSRSQTVQARRPGGIEIPSVTAHTAQAAKREVHSTTVDGFYQERTVRSIGVSVDYHFFHAPPEPFEVQCFFVAKDESNKARYIYDFHAVQSRRASGSLEFSAHPLAGSGRKWISIPISGESTSGSIGGSFSGSLDYCSEILGSKVDGWIVRFVSGGKVLKIASNQSYLTSLAEKAPGFLNAAAAGRGARDR